ncbi:MAG: SURF1 family protein [Gammaproteobacteria bacterium]|nr:SURF1 family protein [Gammaproteobacteria bacterium]MYF28756.1 SURF1 family protein [Gammaproteobacteria bacterium]MYK47703.1 SURF1 family protein [Gammaproteobacteria bacterium]
MAGQRAFRPGRALTLQVAAALVTTVGLATWQITRALDKMALADARDVRLQAEPVDAPRYAPQTPDFTRLALTGQYDPERLFLVAERPRTRGFDVVSVLKTDTGSFLVNRGWTLRSPSQAVPETPTGMISVIGVVWPTTSVSDARWQEVGTEGWPKTARVVNPERMAAATGAHAREIRLEAGGAGVFRAASLAWDYEPGTHWSYAVQWLLIGLGVGIGYVLIGRRRGREVADDA